jgi:hypothetical protein
MLMVAHVAAFHLLLTRKSMPLTASQPAMRMG